MIQLPSFETSSSGSVHRIERVPQFQESTMPPLRSTKTHLALPLAIALLVTGIADPGWSQRNRKAQDAEEAADQEDQWGALTSSTFSGLSLREIGPALPSGRISDLAVVPENPKVYYAAIASGGLFKTENSGTTWKPIFDRYPSYSVGAITLDPNNSLVLWVGTGENNSQRSVAYGDGVYLSLDGGRSFKNVGLKESEHIGMIKVDPRDSDVVYVAAQGPLWSAGGDRGLYKTTDRGETWNRVLEIDEHTGVSEVLLDPRDPDVVYAVAYQRARRVWTLINGGPGSGLHKSTDGGATWKKINKGLPTGADMGRIGIAMAPTDPDLLYALVETSDSKTRGTYVSTDGGENWSKRSSYLSGSPQYYQELFVDPHDKERVYSMDTFLMVTDDGGRNWRRAGEQYKHVDNHALWIDPEDPDHLLIGTDGGVYESWDRATTWNFKANLPVAQFYKIAVDNAEPFYNVYGGTQDNNTVGGPSQTTHRYGISNREWFFTLGGDGFQPAVDPNDPNIVYSQWQHGNLVRHDRRTGENVNIKPVAAPGDDPLRWNWDSPLLISPHDPSRLYFAAQRVFRSDNRGESWSEISEDLSSDVDRNTLEIMGRTWSIDAVSKNRSTSVYGSVVALTESPITEGLLYAGTDDGLIHVIEPGGASKRLERPSWVPDRSYVSDLVASRHDAEVVYATYNNHKAGDFKPYVLRSADRGTTWTNLSADLPERGSTWTLVEDPIRPELLFVGTEFGVFFTVDGGSHWVQLKNGIPTIAVRDLAIQERENDLVVGSFGRGFFVLDDYSPLRQVTQEGLEQEAVLFPVPEAKMFIPSNPLSGEGKGFLGHAFYTAPNPEFGATFTYYLKDSPKTLRAQRREREKKALEEGTAITHPSWEELQAEEDETAPAVHFVIEDADGVVVRRIAGKSSKGLHRTHWDLRLASASPPREGGGGFRRGNFGAPAMPGTYTVRMERTVRGETTVLGEPQTFTTAPLRSGSLPVDAAASDAFRQETRDLQKALVGTQRALSEAQSKLEMQRKVTEQWPAVPRSVLTDAEALRIELRSIQRALNGDRTRSPHEQPPESVSSRVNSVVFGHWSSTANPTDTQRQSSAVAREQLREVAQQLRRVIDGGLARIDAALDAAGAPWTPGRWLEVP